MLKARHKDLHVLLKIAEWLTIMLVSVLIVFALWYMLPINHASTGALLTLQALQSIGLFILPALAVAYLWSEQPLRWLKLRSGESRVGSQESRDKSRLLVLLSMGVVMTAIPLINCLVHWNQAIRLPASLSGLEQMMMQMEEQAEQLLERFMTHRDGAWWMLLLNLLVLAVLPAVGEELTFRGVMQGLIIQNSKFKIQNSTSGQKPAESSAIRVHVAVWVTATVFSFVHFQFYGFIPRLLMGALLGYALVWSGRIGYSMVMHATNNAASVLVFYLSTYIWHLPQEQVDAIGTGDTWWLTAVCTPVMIVLLYLFYRLARTEEICTDLTD